VRRERKIQLCGQARQGVLIHDMLIVQFLGQISRQFPGENGTVGRGIGVIAGAFTRIENELWFGKSGLLGETRSCRCVSFFQ
jgi:hypothetical protein